jgi:hypothetical protein
MRTFTAQVGPSNASQLSAISVDGATEALMEDIGEGTVKINDLDRLRQLGEDEDGRVTEDDDEGLQIWIGGESYPIFDDVEAVVAEAMGLQTRFVDAKQTFDHARNLYAASVASVVEATGSAAAAAEALGIEEAEVLALVPPPAPEPVVEAAAVGA